MGLDAPRRLLVVISVINHTSMSVPDEEVQAAIRAVNRQIQEDFKALLEPRR
jgi:hypothetical protein